MMSRLEIIRLKTWCAITDEPGELNRVGVAIRVLLLEYVQPLMKRSNEFHIGILIQDLNFDLEIILKMLSS